MDIWHQEKLIQVNTKLENNQWNNIGGVGESYPLSTIHKKKKKKEIAVHHVTPCL